MLIWALPTVLRTLGPAGRHMGDGASAWKLRHRTDEPLGSGRRLFAHAGLYVSVAMMPLQVDSIIPHLFYLAHQSLTDVIPSTVR